MLENVSSVFNLGASSEATGKPPFTSLRPKLGFGKGTFLSEDTDAFVITPNRQTFFFPETENLNFVIFVIFKAALASSRWLSCPYKALSFHTLRRPQFPNNFQSPKFKVCLEL